MFVICPVIGGGLILTARNIINDREKLNNYDYLESRVEKLTKTE